jgi:hypothetical protein
MLFNRTTKLLITVSATFAILTAVAPKARAQGCIVGRNCSDGAIDDSEYLMPHGFEWSINYRGFKANKHYNGDVRQSARETDQNFVINRQNQWNATGTWGLTDQTSIYLDIPYVNNSWSLPLPIGPPAGMRWTQNTQGIGDMSAGVQYWLMKAATHPNGNIQFSLGVQAPTGSDDEKSNFPNSKGTDVTLKYNDVSIQPGTGSWAYPLAAQAFRDVHHWDVFTTFNYLVTPKDTNGVPSLGPQLGFPASPLAPSTAVNSVPDQYLFRIGLARTVPKIPSLTATVAFRDEGVPVHDLIGGSHGFRRAGYSHSIEPALTYTRGDSALTVDIPYTIRRDREPTDPDGVYVSGDATFADSQLIINFTQRYGH